MTPFNPDDWKDVIVLVLIFTVTPVLTAGLPLWFKVKKIDGQVSNTHTENMRDEITRGFKEVRQDISGLREEIRTERLERIEGDRRRDAA